ncbi:MAG: response regulator [Nitrospirae bacterium]|nr:response regulator [Nitrospirota bacterium]
MKLPPVIEGWRGWAEQLQRLPMRWQIPLLVGAVGLALLGVWFLWQGRATIRYVEEAERAWAGGIHQTVVRAMEDQRFHLHEEAERLAHWGELAVFVAVPDPYWGEANLGRWVRDGRGDRFLAVFDREGKPLYVSGAAESAIPALPWHTPFYGYAVTPMGVAAVALEPIRSDARGAAPEGSILLGRVLGSAFADDLGGLYHVTFHFQPASHNRSHARGNLQVERLEVITAEQRSTSDLVASETLAPLLRVEVEHPNNPLQALFRALRLQWIVIMAFTGLLMVALAWALQRIVYRPMAALSDDVQDIRQAGDPKARARIAGPPEVRDLAEAVNDLLASLESTQVTLLQSEKLSSLGQLVAGAAHELNNPLTTVVGFAELAMEKKECPEEVRRDLSRISEGALRAAHIVRNLLTFARTQDSQKRPVGLNGILESVLDLVAYQLRVNNITLRRELAPNAHLPKVLANYHQMQQVFLNLVTNAYQAMASLERPGVLTVRTEPRGERIRVMIADTGPGISHADLPRIFDPFFTTKPVGQGTGLGLSVSYGIVRTHGGKIWVESAEGKGATFFVEMPVAAEAEDGTTPVAAVSPAEVSRSRRVLIVDDEPAIVDVCFQLFRQMGHRVDVAYSGQEALRKCQQSGEQGYDLILLDLKMPEMSGEAIYRHIAGETPRMADRVLCTTGDTLSRETAAFLVESGRPVLHKPFTMEQFRVAVLQVLDQAES